MKIEINIPQINIPQIDGLATAINALADAMNKKTTVTSLPSVNDKLVNTNIVQNKQVSESSELTPAMKEKAELTSAIIALGGTPPEKGAVGKFREVLESLQQSETVIETPVESKTVESKTVGKPVITVESVRAFAAHYMTLQDADIQREKIKAIIKEAGAETITNATDEQRAYIAQGLEKDSGMTIAEAIKKHSEG